MRSRNNAELFAEKYPRLVAEVQGCLAEGERLASLARSALGWPDETVGQLRFTGILVTRRVSEGSNSPPRLRVGLPFRQAGPREGRR